MPISVKALAKGAKELAHGDVSGLQKLTRKAQVIAGQAAGVATRAATGGSGLVDTQLKRAHDQLTTLHAAYNDVISALKHQIERARKTSKTLRETCTSMQGLAEMVTPMVRRDVQTSMAVESALARSWDEYASNLESTIVAPAKQEIGALFAEGDSLYSSYLALVNELATKQGKERLLGSKTFDPNSQSQQAIYALSERKAADESSKLPRLNAIAEAVEAALAFIMQTHRSLHAAFLRDAYGSVTASAGSGDEVSETSSLLAEVHAGWADLRTRSGSNAALQQQQGAPQAGPPQKVGGFGVALEALSLRSDSVRGVPFVARALMDRLSDGRSSSGVSFLDTEGLFRIPAPNDECEELRQKLDGGPVTARAAIERCTDAHVLAHTLKLWYRRLPSPLVPTGAYRQLVGVGSAQQSGAEGAKADPLKHSESQIESLRAIVRSLPQPNLLNLYALLEFLEAVVSNQVNRMSAANLTLVFAPTICRPESKASSAAEEMEHVAFAAHALAILLSTRARCFPRLAGSEDADEPPDASTVAASGGAGSSWWYSDSGEQVGPVTGGELAALLRSGQISLSTWVFESGTADWQELSAAESRLPKLTTM